MKIRFAVALSIVIAGCLAAPAFAQDNAPPPRPTITIAPFDTDRTGWMPPPRLGDTVAELLTDRLVNAGTFRVTDRQWLVSAASDQGHVPFDQLVARAADASVDYLVAGAVTRLSFEEQSSSGGGFIPLPIGGAIVHKHKTQSVIGLTIRVIDVHTGEIVATSAAERSAAEQHTSGGGFVVIGVVPIIGAKGSSAVGFEDRLLQEAMQQTVTAAADKLVAAAARLGRARTAER